MHETCEGYSSIGVGEFYLRKRKEGGKEGRKERREGGMEGGRKGGREGKNNIAYLSASQNVKDSCLILFKCSVLSVAA